MNPLTEALLGRLTEYVSDIIDNWSAEGQRALREELIHRHHAATVVHIGDVIYGRLESELHLDDPNDPDWNESEK